MSLREATVAVCVAFVVGVLVAGSLRPGASAPANGSTGQNPIIANAAAMLALTPAIRAKKILISAQVADRFGFST